MNQPTSTNLRRALGQFMTGVTIVTTVCENNNPVGVTANSFNSVSLDPPLVLWSLSENAHSKTAFQNSEYFCVHVLTATQKKLAERFARSGVDKFGGLNWSRGLGSIPLLREYVAQFQCRTTAQHRVGDHIVFFGEVIRFETTNERPLVFMGGRYSLAERRKLDDTQGTCGIDYYPGDRRTIKIE